ncbi:MAG: nucleotidyltransferase domain-containing protein [Alphaproteobacteria bacterium]|jgi:hypothetical protein|nr:nucleotidyltransferase domain-containing protein [Alphaproteobacteria bacterium]MCV6599478.1 nucleotidyltransferase domain-containing protein [Alphaproteobacteria bacterium]
MKHLEIVNDIIKKYPKAKTVFLCGSFASGLETKASDIDIQIIMSDKDLPKAYRKSFYYKDFPVELFFNSEKSLNLWFERARNLGTGGALYMLGFAKPMIENKVSKRIQNKAKKLLKKGPKVLSKQEIYTYKHIIADARDDVIGAKNESDFYTSLSLLYGTLSDFYLRYNKMWSTTRVEKHRLRALNKQDEKMYKEFSKVFHTSFKNKEIKEVVKLTNKILSLTGDSSWETKKVIAPFYKK